MNFYMVYQPQFQDSKIVGLEALLRPEDSDITLEQFIHNQPSKMTLDLDVIRRVIKELENCKFVKTVSINIHPSSLLNASFVKTCIKLCSTLKYQVILELIEYETYKICQSMIDQINHLRENKIELAIDDFGKSFSNADTIIQLPISKIKIDGSLVENIENNSLKFKFLNFLNGIIVDIVKADVVFEQVENRRQFEFIELINSKAIIQGFYFEKPMRIEELAKKYDKESFVTPQSKSSEDTKSDLFDFMFEYIKKNIDVNSTIYNQNVNEIFKQQDKLKLTHNSDFNISWDNFKDTFLNRSNSLHNQFIRMINTKDRLVVVRNSSGVVVFDNLTHIKVIGASLVGVEPKNIVGSNSEYSMCILRDRLFLDSQKSFEVSQEYYGKDLFEIIREKISHNNEIFVMCSIYKSDNGVESPLNKIVSYSFLKKSYKSYLGQKAIVVTFKAIAKKRDLKRLERKIFNLYVLAKTFRLEDEKFLFIPVVDSRLLFEQLDIIVKNDEKLIVASKQDIIIENKLQF